MIKFLKILFQRLFKKKNKSIADYLNKKKASGTLPAGVDVVSCGKGIYRVSAENELSFEEVIDIIENFAKGKKDGDY